MSECSEMNSEDLPSSLKTTLTKLINENVISPKSFKSVPKGAADYYSYKITVDDGKNQREITCNQYDIPDSVKSLVTYVERHNKKEGNALKDHKTF